MIRLFFLGETLLQHNKTTSVKYFRLLQGLFHFFPLFSIMMFFLLDSPSPGNLGTQRHLLSFPRVLKSLNHCLLLGNKKWFLYLMIGQNQLVFRLLPFQGFRNYYGNHFINARYRVQQSHCMVWAKLALSLPSAQGDGPDGTAHRPELSLSLK